MEIKAIELFLLIAAVWRLSNLVANEEGPFHMFSKLRRSIGLREARSRRKNGLLSRLHLYEGVQCEYCNSIWFGVLLGWPILITRGIFVEYPIISLIFPLALSTGAIIIKHVVYLLKSLDTRLDQQNQRHLEDQKNLLAAYSKGHTLDEILDRKEA